MLYVLLFLPSLGQFYINLKKWVGLPSPMKLFIGFLANPICKIGNTYSFKLEKLGSKTIKTGNILWGGRNSLLVKLL